MQQQIADYERKIQILEDAIQRRKLEAEELDYDEPEYEEEGEFAPQYDEEEY